MMAFINEIGDIVLNLMVFLTIILVFRTRQELYQLRQEIKEMRESGTFHVEPIQESQEERG